ncbi:unnamed protein product, partial [Mesorhabditis spiculigera]
MLFCTLICLLFASVVASDQIRAKRQFETEVTVRTAKNEWRTSYQQPLDSLLESGVPNVLYQGLPGNAPPQSFVRYRAFAAPALLPAGAQRVVRQDPNGFLGPMSKQGTPQQTAFAPVFNYFYPDPLTGASARQERLGNAEDNKKLFDMLRFDAATNNGNAKARRTTAADTASPTVIRRYFFVIDGDPRRMLQKNVEGTRDLLRQVKNAVEIARKKNDDRKNELSAKQAAANELHAGIGLYRRREVELAKQMDSWIMLIAKQRAAFAKEDARFNRVSKESDRLCEDLEGNLALLRTKRMSVDNLVIMIAESKTIHMTTLAGLRGNLRKKKEELQIWDTNAVANKRSIARLYEDKMMTRAAIESRRTRLAELQNVCSTTASRISAIEETNRALQEPLAVTHEPHRAQIISLEPMMAAGKQPSLQQPPANRTIQKEYVKTFSVKPRSPSHHPRSPSQKAGKSPVRPASSNLTLALRPEEPARAKAPKIVEMELRSGFDEPQLQPAELTPSKADLYNRLGNVASSKKPLPPQPTQKQIERLAAKLMSKPTR